MKYNLSMLKPIVDLSASIKTINMRASLNPKVREVNDKYTKLLAEGVSANVLCKDYANEMNECGLDCAKSVVADIDMAARMNSQNLNILREFAKLKSADAFLCDAIESKLTEYLTTKEPKLLSDIKQSLDALCDNASMVSNFIEALNVDSYNAKISGTTQCMELCDDVCDDEGEVLYTEDDMKAAVAKALEAERSKREENVAVKAIPTAAEIVNLPRTINAILKKEPNNPQLRAYCESYNQAMRDGDSQEFLYESFINGLSRWTYLNAVDTEMSALKNRTDKYKQDIDLMKILKVMSESTSYFIVPLIKESVESYMGNKNATTRTVLVHNCQAFEYDPFVKDILNVVLNDVSIDSLYMNHTLYDNTAKIKSEDVYSPVQFIKENETVFNIGGTYYTRKGNVISKLAKSEIANLNESFKHACTVMNRDGVDVSRIDDCINVYGIGDKASIDELGITINGEKVELATLKNPIYMSSVLDENNHEFYDSVLTIAENFDTIGRVDFVHRVSYDGCDKSVDLFKIKNTISLSLNEDGFSTFYYNVNPMQCRNYINEHMNVNVDEMFEEELPNQKKIVKEVASVKAAYQERIDSLTDKKEELTRMCDDDNDAKLSKEDKEAIQDAISVVDTELEAAKKDYADYEKTSSELLGTEKPEDDAAKSAALADEVDGVDADADELSEPITEPESGDEDSDMYVTANVDDVEDIEIPTYSLEDDDAVAEPSVDIATATVYDSVLDATANDSFQVVKVEFEKNVKSGKTSRNGSAYIMIPTVNANGDIKSDLKIVTFYLDDSKRPILNNDSMPLSMYNTIVNAISTSEDIESVDMSSEVRGSEVPQDVVEPEVAAIDEPAVDADMAEPIDSVDSLNAENAPIDDVEVPSVDKPSEEPSDVEPVAEEPSVTDSSIAISDVEPLHDEEVGEGEEVPAVEAEDTPDVASVAEPIVATEVSAIEYPLTIGFTLSNLYSAPYEPLRKFDIRDFVSYMERFADCNVRTEGDNVVLELGSETSVYKFYQYFEVHFGAKVKQFMGTGNGDGWFPNLYPSLHGYFARRGENQMYESLSQGRGKTFSLPYDDYLYSRLLNGNFDVEDATDTLYVTVRNDHEYDRLCESLIDYKKNFLSLDEETVSAINEALNTATVIEFAYDGKVSVELQKRGLSYTTNNGKIQVTVNDINEAQEVQKVINKTKVSALNESELSEKYLFEGMKITVEDTETHKKIVIDADKMKSEEEEGDDKDEDKEGEDKSQEDTSFGDDTQLFNSEEEAAEQKNGEKQDEAAESPFRKKFKFCKKVHESVETPKVMNEGLAAPNIMDKVIYDGKNGQIYGKNMNGEFLVLVQGSTVVCRPSEVKALYPREDSLECNFKYDPKTLCGIYEQAIPCRVKGIANEGLYCKCGDYLKGKSEGVVKVYTNDGKNSDNVVLCDITLNESIENYSNVSDYKLGSYIKEGVQYGVYYNSSDYEKGGYVRCLKLTRNGETKMVTMPRYEITAM